MNTIVRVLLENDAKIYGECVREFVINNDNLEPQKRKLKAIMTYEDCDGFLHACRQSSMKACLLSAESYDGIMYESNAELTRYEISLDMMYWKLLTARYPIPLDLSSIESQCKEHLPVIIDIIRTCRQVDEPFHETIDFECNSLFLTKFGLNVSKQVDQTQNKGILSSFYTLNRVVEDIKHKRAKLMYSTAPHIQERADELIRHGWIVYDDNITTCKPSTTEELDICVICHGRLDTIHYKMQCCNAHYHKNCLASSINKGFDEKCMMCQQDVCLDECHTALLG